MKSQATLSHSARRLSLLCVALACASLLVGAIAVAPASAAFGFKTFDAKFTNADGSPATQAGAHPFAVTNAFELNYSEVGPGQFFPDGQLKDAVIEQVAGLIGDATAMPQCTTAEFFSPDPVVGFGGRDCKDDTAVGQDAAEILFPGAWVSGAIYNLVPPPGVTVRLGFNVVQVNVIIDVRVKAGGEYNVVASQFNTPQAVTVYGAVVQLWGDPSDPAHDRFRGDCGTLAGVSGFQANEIQFLPKGESCPVQRRKPFLTLPGSCRGPLSTSYQVASWEQPQNVVRGSVLTHDAGSPPNPQGFTGCGRVPFAPGIDSQATTDKAETPTGLDFGINFDQEGLVNPEGLAQSEIKKAVIRLPEGMSLNPSIAEGLGVCSEEDLAREDLGTAPGAGCPNSSQIGTVEVETPLLDEPVKGSVYLATQNKNPFHSLVAMYIVLRSLNKGILVKLPAKVEPDPRTGQVVTVVEDIPQLPFSHFRFHFREGQRSPLASPPLCGDHETVAELTPWANPDEILTTTSSFKITSGVNGGPCADSGTPPFHPGLEAGTLNNAAGSYSPFNARLTRNDGEQEFTHFSIKLPPGITGRLAGVSFCPESGIAQVKSREREGGGSEELASPSCPSASEVGRTLVGAGVGGSLTYVPGKVYLAGPYHGAPLSIVAITSGVVGPFDIGTVVVREALKIDPETAEVFVDATGSDPIPHIVSGIPVHARDIRVYVDRPDFVLNPTSCAPTSVASTVLGSGLDFASSADDVPVTVTSRFQAADCANLNYHPRLALKLKGGIKRGKNPQLTAILRPRPGDANSKRISVALPHSEFLDQSHIKTICTRVQFKAGEGNGSACPKGSIYGHVRAWTPLLSDPLVGNVYLRSSEHPLPDLVLALHGQIEFTAVGRIDSVKGGIRNTFEAVPDAPITKVEVKFLGGKKGLLINSTNICKGKHRANLDYTAHSGKTYEAKAPLQAKCKKAKKKHRRKHSRRHK